MKRLVLHLSIAAAFYLLVNLGSGTLRAATPAYAGTQSVATPLPLTCSGTPVPAVCVYGYVYYDGAPVSGASVKIDSPYGTLSTTTATGLLSSAPYYQANLSGTPLLVSPGDTITVAATYNGSTASGTYVVAPDGQQVDVVIAASALFGDGASGDWEISGTALPNEVRSALSSTATAGQTIVPVATTVGFQ